MKKHHIGPLAILGALSLGLLMISSAVSQAQVSLPTSTCQVFSPTITVASSPNLTLSYSSGQKEDLLTSTFSFKVSGGNTGVSITNFGSVTYTNQTDPTKSSNGTSLITPVGYASTSQDIYGQTLYMIAPGQSAQFTITNSLHPAQMFAGTYFASLSSLYTNIPHQNCGASLAVPANHTNSKTIVGELSPYLNGFATYQPFTAGQNITVLGTRLDASGGVLIDGTSSATSAFTVISNSNQNTFSLRLPTVLADGYHTLQIVSAKYGASNGLSFQVGNVTTGSSQATVTLNGKSTLVLNYGSTNGGGLGFTAARESSLVATIPISITAGASSISVYKNYFPVTFVNTTATNNSYYSSGMLTPTINMTVSTDSAGQQVYVIAAGKTISFNVVATANPQIMFAGNYYATAQSGEYADVGLNAATQFKLTVPANQTNSKVVAGEQSPYISTVIPNSPTVGQTVSISGQRLGDTVLLIDGVQQSAKVTTSNNATIATFTMPSATPGWHTIALKNNGTGASNNFGVQIQNPTQLSLSVSYQGQNPSGPVYAFIASISDPRVTSITVTLSCPSGVSAVMKANGNCNDSGNTVQGNSMNWQGLFMNSTSGYQTVTVSGKAFASNGTVISTAQTTVTIPPTSQTVACPAGYICVAPGGTVVCPAGYTCTVTTANCPSGYTCYTETAGGSTGPTSAPILNSISPTTIAPGGQLTLSGSGFVSPYTSVGFDGPSPFPLDSPNSIATDGNSLMVIVPTAITPGQYRITASNAVNGSYLKSTNSFVLTVTSPSTGSQPSVSATLIDASNDKAGIWNVFGPGTGRVNNNNPYDWHWNATVSNANGKVLKYATVIMNGIREGWSSSASTNNAFGVQLYPLVVSAPGFLTSGSDQTYAINSNSVSLDMYGQPEDAVGTTFRGATLTIGFTDGTSITTQIPASSLSIPPVTSTASVTGVVSLNASSPLTSAVPVSDPVNNQYMGLPILVFDLKSQNGPSTLKNLVVHVNSSVSRSAPAAYLYQGSTLIGSTAVTDSGVATFMPMGGATSLTTLPANSAVPFLVKVDVGSVTSSGVTVSAAVNASDVTLVDASSNQVTVSGSAQGGSITVTAGSQATLSGSPTITKSVISSDQNGNTVVRYTATFNVNMTAVGTNITLGLPTASIPAVAASADYIQIIKNGVADSLSNYSPIITYIQPTNTTLSNDGSSFTVAQSQTVTIPITVTFLVTNPGANTYGAQLVGINYSSTSKVNQIYPINGGRTNLTYESSHLDQTAAVWNLVWESIREYFVGR